MSPAAEVFLQFKEVVSERFVLEQTIYKVDDKTRYPDGVKYSLIFIDLKTGRRVLMDNHYPKGPHVHLDDLEMKYQYEDEEKLIDDFKQFVFQHMGVRL